jgi:hypothetical protein
MKKILLLLVIILAIQTLPAQVNEGDFYVPLYVFTNGPGRIHPFRQGEVLRVGRRYAMTAIPERGYKFAGWQPVDVFIITQTNFNAHGEPILPPIQSIVPSLGPTNSYEAELDFTMRDTIWISPDGSNPSIVRAFGWQANFVPWYERLPRLPRENFRSP